MKALIVVLSLAASSLSYAGTSMRLEGQCRGTLMDGSKVAFTYYSNFDGCKANSRAAIAFTSGKNYANKGLLTGSRSFKNGKDIYSFVVRNRDNQVDRFRLEFADSTGNTGGVFKTEHGESVKVRCEIRDYEYSEC